MRRQSSQTSSLHIENVDSGETIHQRCLLIKGRSSLFEAFGDYISVTVTDAFGMSSPSQTWPMSQGYFKSLVLLTPGNNTVKLQRYNNLDLRGSIILELNYVPLLQTPPLHCAIMVAKDSPLLIDCPHYKAAGISSAHSSLNAAIAKFRTTAYMWQALTAEDMRAKGLGRRSFRLEEEYGLDTTSRVSVNTIGQRDQSKYMGSVAKIHLVRSEKSTAELRDPNVAQQNDHGSRRDDLHKYFEEALKKTGGVFESSTRPVVAGMILDSHYSMEDDLLLGHAALGCHNPKGLSLGVFGSHLTYSWPRFFEEIAACLTDTTPPGDSLCNDNGECETAWEACSIGQGAFLHEVGHAFGAPHTTGIMARGYAQDWPKAFLSQTAYCAKTKSDGITVIDGQTENDACWDLKDALSLKQLPHFRLPGDIISSEEVRKSMPSIFPLVEDESQQGLVFECKAGIKQVTISAGDFNDTIYPVNGTTRIVYEVGQLNNSVPLAVMVLGENGKERKLANAWRLLAKQNSIRIPDSDVILRKYTSGSGKDKDDEDESMIDDENAIQWAVMLNEKGSSGNLSRANAIDLRVGCILDGAVVHFEDGHKTPCGPHYDSNGREHRFGGHASQILHIPNTAQITKVVVNRRGWGSAILGGIRMTLSTGKSVGELNQEGGNNGVEHDSLITLQPANGERIIGFFGQSQAGGYCTEFGIITADKDVELPPQTYDMAELQNIQSRR